MKLSLLTNMPETTLDFTEPKSTMWSYFVELLTILTFRLILLADKEIVELFAESPVKAREVAVEDLIFHWREGLRKVYLKNTKEHFEGNDIGALAAIGLQATDFEKYLSEVEVDIRKALSSSSVTIEGT
jgi:hypothetical protein